MTEAFGALCIEIYEREEQICERLIQHVYVHIADVQIAVRFTAELDAFMALATFSQVSVFFSFRNSTQTSCTRLKTLSEF